MEDHIIITRVQLLRSYTILMLQAPITADMRWWYNVVTQEARRPLFPSE